MEAGKIFRLSWALTQVDVESFLFCYRSLDQKKSLMAGLRVKGSDNRRSDENDHVTWPSLVLISCLCLRVDPSSDRGHFDTVWPSINPALGSVRTFLLVLPRVSQHFVSVSLDYIVFKFAVTASPFLVYSQFDFDYSVQTVGRDEHHQLQIRTVYSMREYVFCPELIWQQ